MYTKILLAIVMPFILLTQSVLVMHIHEDHLHGQASGPHIHLFEHKHHDDQHQHVHYSSNCAEESSDEHSEETVIALSPLSIINSRLILDDIKSGTDYVLLFNVLQGLTVTTFNSVTSEFQHQPEFCLSRLPSIKRNALLRL